MIYNKAVIKELLNIPNWMAPTRVIERFLATKYLTTDRTQPVWIFVRSRGISSSPNAAEWIMYKKIQNYLRKNMQMAHTIRNETLRSITQTEFNWFGSNWNTSTLQHPKALSYMIRNVGHVSDWRNHIHNSHGLKRALDQSMNESMGVYAEHVSWDCPGCESVAREGLGHWLVEFGDVWLVVLCQPLATQIYKELKIHEPSIAGRRDMAFQSILMSFLE